MLRRILIANRGEIAMRIIRTAKQLNIETVVAYSTEDRISMPVRSASKAVCIGEPPAIKSYLNQDVILQTAISMGCDAIHPGYGFLAENAEFAGKCKENGLIFIGPNSETIREMGNKRLAKKIAEENGIPVVPGSKSCIKDAWEAKKVAEELGYPVLIKASFGGGGRGMRVAYDAAEIENAFWEAKIEATNSFGDGSVYIEKYIENPKHIEVQILGDNSGNVVSLGNRDCSLQRRNQKVIEEAPPYSLDKLMEESIKKDAVKLARAINYISAGTVEFIVDNNNQYYFMEMNTRIQVEHPVTEMINDIDLVKEQLIIAGGGTISFSKEDVKEKGAAIECRVNAENINNNFMPSIGSINKLYIPKENGIRVETAVEEGSYISPYYDSMIAKIIVCEKNRKEAIDKMVDVLRMTKIEGITTNKNFLIDILTDEKYVRGEVNTNFINEFIENRYY